MISEKNVYMYCLFKPCNVFRLSFPGEIIQGIFREETGFINLLFDLHTPLKRYRRISVVYVFR